MAMFQFSERAKQELRLHGWYETRESDVDDILLSLCKYGISPSQTAVRFIEEFHGLHLQLPNGGFSAMDFNIEKVLDYVGEYDFPHLESLVQQSLCPAGVGGRFLMFIAQQGKVFFLHDEWMLYLLAQNVESAVDTILFSDNQEYQTFMLDDEDKPLHFRDE